MELGNKVKKNLKKRKLEIALLLFVASVGMLLAETRLVLERTSRRMQQFEDLVVDLETELDSDFYLLQKSCTYIVSQVVSDEATYYCLQNGTSGKLVDYSTIAGTIISYAVDSTTSKGGSIMIKNGAYNARVTLKDSVSLVIEKGASGITVSIDKGATAWLYDYENDLIKHWSNGTLVYHLEDGHLLTTQSLNPKEYFWSGENRTDVIANPLLVADWIVYRHGSSFKAKNCTDQKIVWTDDSPSTVIQNTLNCGGVIFIKNATYSLDVIPLNVTVEYTRITGNYPKITIPDGKMVRSTTNVATWAIFQIKTSHIEIDHLILDGNGDDQDYIPYWMTEEGLITIWKERWNTDDLKSTDVEEDVRIHDCMIKDSYAASIAINKYSKVEICNNVIDCIQCTIDGAPFRGVNIHITWSNDSWIHHNWINIASTWTGASNNIMLFRGGSYADLGQYGCARIIIENNILWHCQDCPIEAFGGTNEQPNTYHHQILISNNIIYGAAIYVSNTNRDVEVSNNLIALGSGESGWNSGIQVGCHRGSTSNRTLRNILIHGNHITGSFTPYAHPNGVEVFSNGGVVQDITISDNHIHDIGVANASIGDGIVIRGDRTASPNHVTRIKLHGNKLHGMGKHGIYIENTVAEAEIVLEDNEIYNNGKYSPGYGIYLAGNGSFTIRGNDIYDDQSPETQDGGICLASSAAYGRIMSNRIESGTGLTIGLDNDNWWVTNNDFYGCTTDVKDNSGGMTIYGGNRNQAGIHVDGWEP